MKIGILICLAGVMGLALVGIMFPITRLAMLLVLFVIGFMGTIIVLAEG